MTTRTTLTKSLHTVTAVSRLAANLIARGPMTIPSDRAVRDALAILGQPSDWSSEDETFAKCVAATAKLVQS